MRPYWKGNLKLALVSCPVALHAACSTSERVAFRQINKATVNRLRQQLVDEETVIEIDRFVPRPRIDQRFQRVEQFAAGQEQLAAGQEQLTRDIVLGYSLLSHCCTSASLRSNARCSGFWQVMPSCARPCDVPSFRLAGGCRPRSSQRRALSASR